MRTSHRVALLAANAVLITLGTSFSLLTLLVFVLDAVCVFRMAERESYALLLFLMPFATIFKLVKGMPSLFQFLLLFAALVIALRRRRFSALSVSLICLFVGYIAVGSVGGISLTIKFAGELLLLYFITEGDESENVPLYTYALTGGVLASSLVAKLDAFFPGIANYTLTELPYRINGVDAPRFTALYGDPNYYTVAVILSASLLLLLYARGRLGWPFFLLFAALTYFGFGTGSKSFFLLLALLCLCILYVLLKQGKRWVFWLCGAAVVMAFVMMAMGKFDALYVVISRLGKNEVGDITTGRTDIWRSYFDAIFSDVRILLFGAGLGAEIPETTESVPHSTYIDCLYYLGIFGTLLLLLLLGNLLLRRLPSTRPSFENCIPLFMLVALYAFLSELSFGEVPFHLMLAWLGLIYARAQEREAEKAATLPPPALSPVGEERRAPRPPRFASVSRR